ncbi:FtsK/SpoIIIE domain-containing protein [Lacisediminihabitans sp. FW035]
MSKSRFIANTVDDLTDRKRHDYRIPAKKWFFAIALACLAIVVSALAGEPVALGVALVLSVAAALALGGLSASTSATNTLAGWGAATRIPFAAFTIATGIALPIATTVWAPSISHLAPSIATFLAAHRWPVAALSVACWIGFSVFAARSHSSGSATQEKIRLQYAASLAKAFPGAGSENLWLEKAGISLRGSARDELHVVPAPPGLSLADANDNLAREMPEWVLGAASNQQQLVLLPLTRDPAEAERREMMRRSGGLVSHTIKMPDTASRAFHYLFRLAPGISPARAHDVEVFARTQNLELIHWLPQYGEAFCGQLPSETTELRRRLAELVGAKNPWDLEILLAPHRDGQPGAVTFTRYPAELDAVKRIDHYQTAIRALVPVADAYWVVEDDVAGGTMRFERQTDPLAAVQPYPWDAPVSHERFPFAMGADGELVSLGLLETNLLFGGIPGGGKSGGITAALAGISRLENVALIGLDPKRVELSPWASRFTRISKTDEYATQLLEALVQEMDRRYEWLDDNGLKKFTPAQFDTVRPLLCVVIDELADLVSVGVDKEEKEADLQRSTMVRRLIAKGRAAGIIVLTATQKPEGSVIPTALRDLIQQRVAFATTTGDMTDTVLGKGMGAAGGLAHEIAANAKGVCFIVNETSRIPKRARAFWVPDADVEGLAKSTAHLRVELPWLPPQPGRTAVPETGEPETEIVEREFTFTLDDLDLEPAEPVVFEPAPTPLPDFWA